MRSKYVVNSTTDNLVYAFFLPIVNILWKKYMLYEPISILVGTRERWEKKKFLLSYIENDSRVIFVNDNINNYKESTIAQSSRLVVASSVIFNPEDYIITSDVDMLPLNSRFFNCQCGTKAIHLWNADAYTDITRGWEPPKYPICYIGAETKIWREIMKIQTNDINQEILRIFTGRRDFWGHDEDCFSAHLKTSRFYKNDCQLMVRGGFAEHSRAKDRLDRENWYFDGSQKNYLDCHFIRPGYDHLSKLILLIHTYFPDIIPWLNEYISVFMKNKKA